MWGKICNQTGTATKQKPFQLHIYCGFPRVGHNFNLGLFKIILWCFRRKWKLSCVKLGMFVPTIAGSQENNPIFQIIAGSMTAFVSSFFQAGIEVSLYYNQTISTINFSTSSTLLTLLVLTFGMDQEKKNKNQKIRMVLNG